MHVSQPLQGTWPCSAMTRHCSCCFRQTTVPRGLSGAIVRISESHLRVTLAWPQAMVQRIMRLLWSLQQGALKLIKQRRCCMLIKST